MAKEKNRVQQAAGTAFDQVEKHLYGFYFRLTGREEDVEPGSMPVKPERSVFILLVTLAIASRLVAEGFAEGQERGAAGAGKTRPIKARAYDAYNSIASLIWDSDGAGVHYVEGAPEVVGDLLLGRRPGSRAPDARAACVIIWSLIWTTFGFTGTWQLLVKIAFIASVFLTFFVVEYT